MGARDEVSLTCTWTFEVEGQPVSWNAGYEIGVVNRRAYNRSDRDVRKIIKSDEAKAYTLLVMHRARESKNRPRDWWQGGLVVVEFDFYLGRNIDCDNCLKFLNDGIQAATGVDDKWYLPRVMHKEWGLRPEQRKVVVRITG